MAVCITIYSPEMLAFINENRHRSLKLCAQAWVQYVGKTTEGHTLFVRGEHVCAVARISIVGLLDVKIITGTSDCNTFHNFMQTNLLPHSMPYNGTNPHSVAIMEKCKHSVPEDVKSIQNVGALVHFYHPTSPLL